MNKAFSKATIIMIMISTITDDIWYVRVFGLLVGTVLFYLQDNYE